jgi:hypothetical protein
VSVELSSLLKYVVYYLLTFITKERKVSFFLLFVLGVINLIFPLIKYYTVTPYIDNSLVQAKTCHQNPVLSKSDNEKKNFNLNID